MPTPEEINLLYNSLRQSVYDCCPKSLLDQSDDIIQVTFPKLLKAFTLKPDMSHGYIWKTAKMAIIDAIKTLDVRRKYEIPSDFTFTEPKHYFHPERHLLSKEILHEILVAIDTIPKGRRAAVKMRLMGFTCKEISSQLNLTYKEAENRTLRGLSGLREILTRRGMKPPEKD